MATAGTTNPIQQPYKLVVPPKEFFRQFSNLAHNRVLNEDFPHEKHLTLKYKGIGTDFTVNAKGSLSVKSESKTRSETIEGRKNDVIEKVDSYATSSEVKFLTGYNRTSTEARINNKGIVKLWTNWEPLEVVSVVKGDNQFNRAKAWVAAYYTRGPFGSGTRFQVRHDKNYTFSLGQKVTFAKNNFWSGAYVDVNLNDLKLTQYNGILGYNVNKNIHFYLEHATSKPVAKPATAKKTLETETIVTERTTVVEGVNGPVQETKEITVETKTDEHVSLLKKIGFGKGTLNGVYKDERIWALLQVGWDDPTDQPFFDFGGVYTITKDSSVRAKVNQDLNLALGVRHRCSKNVSVNLGTLVPLKTPEKFYSSFNTVPVPFGLTVEFNF